MIVSTARWHLFKRENTCGPPLKDFVMSVSFLVVFKKATANFDKEDKSTYIVTTASKVTREYSSI